MSSGQEIRKYGLWLHRRMELELGSAIEGTAGSKDGIWDL